MTELATALATKDQTPQEATLERWLEARADTLGQIVPKAIGVERFTRICLTEVARTPQLRTCTPASIAGSLLLCAELGLEPGPLGWVYLVPFKNECQFVLGYTGMLELARRSGGLKDVMVVEECEGDLLDYEEGLRPKFRYVRARPADRGAVISYAGLFRFTNGGSHLQRLWPEDVEAAKKRSPAGRLDKGPWQSDYTAMALKTVVRRARPWLPLSPLFAQALQHDEQTVILDEQAGLLLPEAVSPDEERES